MDEWRQAFQVVGYIVLGALIFKLYGHILEAVGSESSNLRTRVIGMVELLLFSSFLGLLSYLNHDPSVATFIRLLAFASLIWGINTSIQRYLFSNSIFRSVIKLLVVVLLTVGFFVYLNIDPVNMPGLIGIELAWAFSILVDYIRSKKTRGKRPTG